MKPFHWNQCRNCGISFDTDDITFSCTECNHVNNDLSEARMGVSWEISK